MNENTQSEIFNLSSQSFEEMSDALNNFASCLCRITVPGDEGMEEFYQSGTFNLLLTTLAPLCTQLTSYYNIDIKKNQKLDAETFLTLLQMIRGFKGFCQSFHQNPISATQFVQLFAGHQQFNAFLKDLVIFYSVVSLILKEIEDTGALLAPSIEGLQRQ
ncbi:MAG: hypothetical protein HOE90_09755 [Bacteriovoracaceae bacterium]|jgi:hypothetical protein|nr:hypothetical protein [Bacteriovoracaceae bacterium]